MDDEDIIISKHIRCSFESGVIQFYNAHMSPGSETYNGSTMLPELGKIPSKIKVLGDGFGSLSRAVSWTYSFNCHDLSLETCITCNPWFHIDRFARLSCFRKTLVREHLEHTPFQPGKSYRCGCIIDYAQSCVVFISISVLINYSNHCQCSSPLHVKTPRM